MIRIEHEITIQDEIDEVFSFISNAENNPKWDSDCIMAKITSEEPIGVGTAGESTLDILGKTYNSTFTYDEYDPPHMVSKHIRAGHIKMIVTDRLKEVDNGTQLTRCIEITRNGTKMLMEPFFAKKIKKKFQVSYEKLELYFRLKTSVSF
jgi:uncharacterized protein YndB with AHSA1/START domain